MELIQSNRLFAMQKVFQLTKADEATHTVTGVCTAATPDKEGESCNYDAAKKAYKAWSKEFAKATDDNGQAKSLGNIRVQHTDTVGGKAVDIEFDDENKQIVLTSTPIDDTMWEQIVGGFYTGYSQGGDYAWRICQDCGETVPKNKGNYCGNCKKVVGIEYGPVIAEVSYVDNPCHGSAHFDLVKADGTHRMVKFQKRSASMEGQEQETPELSQSSLDKIAVMIKSAVGDAMKKESKTKRVAGEDLGPDCFAYVGDKDDTSTWKLPIKFSTDEKTKSHLRNALARFEQTKGIPEGSKAKVKAKIEAAAKKHGIEVSDEVKKSDHIKELIKNFIEEKVAERLPADLKKDMYGVARFAGMINDLAYLVWSVQYEAEIEQDGSTLPDELQEDLESLVETFLAMAQEESSELTAATAERIGKLMKVSATGLDKAYNKAAGIINKIKKAVDDHHEAMTAAHEEHAEKVKGHLEDLKDCINCEKPGAKKFVKAIPKTKAGHQETDSEIDEQEEGEVEEIDPSEEGTENIAEKSYSAKQVEKMINKAVQQVVGALSKKEEDDEEDEDEEEKPKSKKAAKSKHKEEEDEEDEEDDEEEEKPKSKKAAPGIGLRNDRRGSGPVIKTMPTFKSDDDAPVSMVKRRSGGGDDDVDPKTVAKALQNGDIESQLKLMKSARPHNAVPSTLVAAVGALGRSRR